MTDATVPMNRLGAAGVACSALALATLLLARVAGETMNGSAGVPALMLLFIAGFGLAGLGVLLSAVGLRRSPRAAAIGGVVVGLAAFVLVV